jgi:hypothetical protein
MNALINRVPTSWANAASSQPLRMLVPAVSTLLPFRQVSVSSAASSAEPGVATGQAAEHTPAYTIEDVDEGGTSIEDGVRVSWYTRKRILGEPKKLVHLLRQVSALFHCARGQPITFLHPTADSRTECA